MGHNNPRCTATHIANAVTINTPNATAAPKLTALPCQRVISPNGRRCALSAA